MLALPPNSCYEVTTDSPNTDNDSLQCIRREVGKSPCIVQRDSVSSIAQVVDSGPVGGLTSGLCGQHKAAWSLSYLLGLPHVSQPVVLSVSLIASNLVWLIHNIYVSIPGEPLSCKQGEKKR